MEADYLARGWQLTENHADADLFVIRGCSVTARAQSDCEKLITHLKRHYPLALFRVCGCLNSTSTRSSKRLKPLEPLKHPDPLPVRTARAYLKVQDGCAGKCTFCIVPKFRGASRSEDFSAVVDRAKRFIDAGYHEIVVTGCNLSLYASHGKRLPDLLSALADLTPHPSSPIPDPFFCRIRLGSVEPGACAVETVHAMSEHANACRFLHLTVQSGSERILRAMRRPYSVRDIDRTASTAVRLMPKLGLGCDLMTGFPGESELDHTATCGLLKRLPFNNAHVFPFSERPGTPAAAFPDAIPKTVRSARAHELSKLIRSKRESFAKSFLGQTVEIVVEDEKSGQGWTGEYLTCKPTSGTYKRKSAVRMLISRTEGDILYGCPN